MKDIKLATIGTGSIVHSFLEAVERVEGIGLEAVYSRSGEKAAAFAKRYGALKIYTDLAQMLKEPVVNTIYVASPNTLHFEQIRMALQAGKHVICEKPMCIRAAQLDELMEIARENDRFLLDATPTGFLPNYEVLLEKLPLVGRIRLVECSYSQYSSRYEIIRKLSKDETQRDGGEVRRQDSSHPAQALCGSACIATTTIPNVFHPAFGGGSLMDINYYNVYLMAALFGMPEQVSYAANLTPTGVDSSGILLLQYPDFVAHNSAAKDTWGVNAVQIEGEDGFLYIEKGSNGLESVRVVTRDSDETFNQQINTLPYPETAGCRDAQSLNRWYYEVQGMVRILETEDHEEAQRRLSITRTTIAILEAARAQAGIHFPGDAS